MRIEVNVAAGEPTATLTGADDFKSLSVVALPPGAQLMAGEATPDGAIRVATADQAWVDIAWLRAAAGVKEGDPGEADFDAVMHTNVLGPMRVIPQVADALAPGARLAVLSSRMGSMGLRSSSGGWLYRASKAALNMLAKVWAAELGSRQIRVATISPGITHTDGHPVRDWGDEIVAPLIARTPLGRIGDPEDVANAAVFLASERGRWITGADLHVSGGFR